MSKKSAYPVRTQDLEEDEDDEPHFRSSHIADSEDEDDKPLVQLTSRKEPVEEKRKSVAERRVPTHT